MYARFRRLLVLVACTLAIALPAQHATAAVSQVAPPTTTVGGYSLTQASKVTYRSMLNSCDKTLLPTGLPFRPLCAVQNASLTADGGLLVAGRATYTVKKGQYLFINVAGVSNGEPVMGTWPGTRAQALDYWFQQSQVGGNAGRVTIDGVPVTLPRGNVVGPFAVSGVPDNATRAMVSGVFVKPLPIGTHRITTSQTFDGALVASTYGPIYGISYARTVNTFTVKVVA